MDHKNGLISWRAKGYDFHRITSFYVGTKALKSGDKHVYILTKWNQHYFFGNNEYNQCIDRNDWSKSKELDKSRNISQYVWIKTKTKEIKMFISDINVQCLFCHVEC